MERRSESRPAFHQKESTKRKAPIDELTTSTKDGSIFAGTRPARLDTVGASDFTNHLPRPDQHQRTDVHRGKFRRVSISQSTDISKGDNIGADTSANIPSSGVKGLISAASQATHPRPTKTLTQISRRFILNPNAQAPPSTQNRAKRGVEPRHSAASASASVSVVASAKKPAENIRKSLILPPPPPLRATASTSKRKRDKLIPPLVPGGYAQKMVRYLEYRKSEHLIWEQACRQKNVSVGSTFPVARVRIIKMKRDRNLLWAKCRIGLDSIKSSIFNYVPPSTTTAEATSVPTAALDATTVTTTMTSPQSIEHVYCPPRQLQSRESERQAQQPHHQREPQIELFREYNIRDLQRLGGTILPSSQGSVIDSQVSIGATQWPDNQLELGSIANNQQGSRLVRQEQPFMATLRTGMSRQLLVEPPTFAVLSSSQGSVGSDFYDDEFDRQEVPTDNGDDANTSSNVNAIVTKVVKDNGKGKDQVREIPNGTKVTSCTKPTLPPTFLDLSLVFSEFSPTENLFVGDLIDIHEPCRPILFTVPSSQTGVAPKPRAWMIDRYQVVPQQRSRNSGRH